MLTFLSMALFILISSGTPGPNNMMLLSSGLNFGFRRTVPHIAGIAIGISALFYAIALGLARPLALFPPLFIAIKVIGFSYALYLAWKIARSAETENRKGGSHPLSLIGAAAFQFVNIKSIAMVATFFAAFTPAHPTMASIVTGGTFWLCLCPLTSSTWAFLGSKIEIFLKSPGRRKTFNLIMAIALALVMLPALLVTSDSLS